MNELDFSSLAKEKVEASPTGGKKKHVLSVNVFSMKRLLVKTVFLPFILTWSSESHEGLAVYSANVVPSFNRVI